MPMHHPEGWAHYGMPDQEPKNVAEFEADPAAFLRKGGYIARVQDGMVWILLGNTAQDSLTGDQPGWRVEEAYRSSDQLGQPIVGYRLNSVGGQLMEAMTGLNVQRHMAVIVDGEVYSAPRLMTAIGGTGVIDRQFDARELGLLLGELKNPLPGKVKVVGVREERR